MEKNEPRLFGLAKSNRDFSDSNTWGKNQFNSSFPASLTCYLHSRRLEAVYLTSSPSLEPSIKHIAIDELFRINPISNNAYFSFESQFLPYQKYVSGNIPRNDLVIIDTEKDTAVSSFEIKLTALPDNSTCELSENEFGAEIVVRPDTMVYLACSIIQKYQNKPRVLLGFLGSVSDKIKDWTQAKYVLPYIGEIKDALRRIVADKADSQRPIIVEPIWKTEGKSPRLSDDCLDVFVWSDFGMMNLFLPDEIEVQSISRHTRSMIWLYKMLLEYCKKGFFDGSRIIDEMSYNTKNDKAFSSSGRKTHHLMACPELLKPRIKKEEIKNIILGGGQNLLSPERRFDAIIYNSPELFD